MLWLFISFRQLYIQSRSESCQSKPSLCKQHRVAFFFSMQGYRCRSESIEDHNVREYQPWQAAEAGESTTPSSNGSPTSSWKMIRKGLQGAIREYLQAPPASTSPRPEFLTDGLVPSTSAVRLEKGLRQMSNVVSAMSNQALSDQGSQGSKKSSQTLWKIADQEEIATTARYCRTGRNRTESSLPSNLPWLLPRGGTLGKGEQPYTSL